ncbi:transcriptional regulator [Emticicia sp. 17c]|uniref:transcriptional regulator n=1 Tax=Emticicia sp. 17c TaxID=3127704 RepID=UPI00301C7517
METYSLEADIVVRYVTAHSFPDGVLAAHQLLHKLIGKPDGRKYFGISFPNHEGIIIYKAAAEALKKDSEQLQTLETYVIRKGDYIYADIHHYMKDVSGIGKTFQNLLANPRIDPNGACIEWYLNDTDVRCMVRLAD